nr:DUF4143 domain-containing protein [Arcanobacterium pluranimalium]
MLGKPYSPRIIDSLVDDVLQMSGAVLIEGPRGCGKTMTAAHHAKSAVFLDDQDTQQLIDVDPGYPLVGERPHLIDEWQLYEPIWNEVRRSVDRKEGFGHYILTGSSVPRDDVTRHSGAGRFIRISQRTMTWAEKGHSTEKVALTSLFDGENVAIDRQKHSLDENLHALLTSGFPAQVELPPEQAQRVLRAYLDEVTRTDVPRIADVRYGPEVLDQLVKALARSTASEVTFKTLRQDLQSVAPNISEVTVANLVEILERLFIVETVPAWVPKLRSKARLRLRKKYHLADAALAAAALQAGTVQLSKDLETTGFLFESAAIHDLRVIAQSLGGNLYHYRDSNGYEIDAVIHLNDGRWGAIEVKLGSGQIESGAERLLKTVEQIDADQAPSFMAVVSGTGMTYTLPNGVQTFPLLALGRR